MQEEQPDDRPPSGSFDAPSSAGAGGSGDECAACNPICVPIEGMMPDGIQTGCCCCCDLRSGVMTQSALLAGLSFLSFVLALWEVLGPGLGVPPNMGMEGTDPIALLAALQVIGILASLLSMVAYAYCFKQAAGRDLKGMRIVFRWVLGWTFFNLFNAVVLESSLDVLMCEAKGEHDNEVCGALTTTNATLCDSLKNEQWPYLQRCQFGMHGRPCGAHPDNNNVRACEGFAWIFQLVIFLPIIGWHGYFLCVLNGLIAEFDNGAGSSFTGTNPAFIG
eukprot:SAG22_NODE_2862_length_2149_cov_2.649268_1_plen_277_part_00